jgi:hypothetical protein
MRMRDTNQCQRPFPRRSAAQTHATILGHNIFHIHPRIRRHLPPWHDSRNTPFFAADFGPMNDFPPFENDAPFTKANCPPDPLYWCPLINSAFTCPYKSTSIAVFTHIMQSSQHAARLVFGVP